LAKNLGLKITTLNKKIFYNIVCGVKRTADSDGRDDIGSGSDTSGVFSIDLSDNEFKKIDVY
jgi:hypothetical protein